MSEKIIINEIRRKGNEYSVLVLSLVIFSLQFLDGEFFIRIILFLVSCILILIAVFQLIRKPRQFEVSIYGIKVDEVSFEWSDVFLISYSYGERYISRYTRGIGEDFRFKAIKNGLIYQFDIENLEKQYVSQIDLEENQAIKEKIAQVQNKKLEDVVHFQRTSLQFLVLSFFSSFIVLYVFMAFILSMKFQHYRPSPLANSFYVVSFLFFLIASVLSAFKLFPPVSIFAKQTKNQKTFSRFIISLFVSIVLTLSSPEFFKIYVA